MNPLELCRLLSQQLGRMPSLSELYAAMGMGTAPPTPAEDPELTQQLRLQDSWDQALVRMMFLGGGSDGGHVSPTLRLPSDASANRTFSHRPGVRSVMLPTP